MSSRQLITGAQGFVGRYLAEYLLASDPDALVLGVGRSERIDGSFTHQSSLWIGPAPLPPGLCAPFNRRFIYEQMSILDCAGMRRILEDFRPSQIFHLASGLHSDPHQHLVETNIRGTISLFEAIAGVNAHKPTVVLGSSASIYGILKSDHLPAKETAQCEPADMYGVTKLASEYISRIAGRREAVPVIVARIFNIVGPGQDERHVCGRMAAALSTAFRRGDAAVTFGSLEATRDFIDVRDVARALMLLGIRGEPDSVYNLANGVETPIRSVLAELIELSGYRGRIAENSSDLNRGVPRSCADVSRLRALGFQPELSLTQSLRDVLLYYSYYAGIDETR